MNVILVCLNNFQNYILTNIKQLIRLKHTSIYVITNKHFFHLFNEYKDNIKLIAVEELNDNYNYNNHSKLDNQFRNGFWTLTSSRFFYLYELMRKYNIENVIHLENDVLIYRNINELENKLDKTKIYLPFDSFTRNIASIMFIPNSNVFKTALDFYDFGKNDMENFCSIQKQTNVIEHFPIFIDDPNGSSEYQFVTRGFNNFRMIFDAAAMGQYLGGVDPQNVGGDTRGFVNETCIIKYDKYRFVWNEIENIKCPFIVVNDANNYECFYPIFNLHIHSKALDKFI